MPAPTTISNRSTNNRMRAKKSAHFGERQEDLLPKYELFLMLTFIADFMRKKGLIREN
jgi:hypothetical protein